jgi:Ferric reductase NAD binding domain
MFSAASFFSHYRLFFSIDLGITPYASALDCLMHRFREQQNLCPNCDCVNYNHAAIQQRKPKKVDIIWTNRTIENFSWFLQLFGDFEKEQLAYLGELGAKNNDRQRFIDFHLYFTSLGSNARGMISHAPYDLINKVFQDDSNRDLLTNLRTKTIAGRPQWALLFSKFKSEHPKTDVFFTGSSTMGHEVKRYCDEYGFNFYHEPYY